MSEYAHYTLLTVAFLGSITAAVHGNWTAFVIFKVTILFTAWSLYRLDHGRAGR